MARKETPLLAQDFTVMVRRFCAKTDAYLRIGSKKSNSEVSSQTVKDQARYSMDALSKISGGNYNDETQKQLLVTETIPQDSEIEISLTMRSSCH